MLTFRTGGLYIFYPSFSDFLQKMNCRINMHSNVSVCVFLCAHDELMLLFKKQGVEEIKIFSWDFYWSAKSSAGTFIGVQNPQLELLLECKIIFGCNLKSNQMLGLMKRKQCKRELWLT